MKENFNIIICGTGGQGIITLLRVVAEAALMEGKDVKTSELHGLAQRGGSVESHIRFVLRKAQDKAEIYSPLIIPGEADLILALEAQEALKVSHYAGQHSIFLIDDQIFPIPGQKSLSKKMILAHLQKISKHTNLIEATRIAAKEIGNPVVAGVFLLSLSAFKKFLPLKPVSILKAIKEVVRPKYFEINKKTFELAKSYAKKMEY